MVVWVVKQKLIHQTHPYYHHYSTSHIFIEKPTSSWPQCIIGLWWFNWVLWFMMMMMFFFFSLWLFDRNDILRLHWVQHHLVRTHQVAAPSCRTSSRTMRRAVRRWARHHSYRAQPVPPPNHHRAAHRRIAVRRTPPIAAIAAIIPCSRRICVASSRWTVPVLSVNDVILLMVTLSCVLFRLNTIRPTLFVRAALQLYQNRFSRPNCVMFSWNLEHVDMVFDVILRKFF